MATLSSKQAFTRKQVDQQISEDMEAGYLIPGILMGIVVFGLVSMIFSIWLTL